MRTFVKGDATTRTAVPARAVDLLARGWVEITDETPPGHEDFDVRSWTPPAPPKPSAPTGDDDGPDEGLSVGY
jgi:hypothetical protein